MIPSWLVSILAAIPSALLVWGGIAAVLTVAGAGVLAVLFLPLPRPVVVLGVLRTGADLVCMGTSWVIAAPRRRRERKHAEHLAWVVRVRSAQHQQRDAAMVHNDFCGCDIPPADWRMFCGLLRGVYREVRETERRRYL